MPKWKFFQETEEEVKVNDNGLESFKNVTLADAEMNIKKILKNINFDEDLVKSAYADLAKEVEEIANDYDDDDSAVESCLLMQEKYTALIMDLIINSENYCAAETDTDSDITEEAPAEESAPVEESPVEEPVIPRSAGIKVLDVYPKGKRKAYRSVDCYRTEDNKYVALATAPDGVIFKNVERATEYSDRDIAWYVIDEHKGVFNPETGKRNVTYHLSNKYSDFDF